LYPTADPFQALIVDETMDIMNDMISQMPTQHTVGGTDDELKIQRHKYRDTIMKPAFRLIESRIEQYSAGTNTVCGVPSVADLFLMSYKHSMDSNAFTHLEGTILNDYPHIVKVANTMMQHPLVVSYHKNNNKK
jgi:glutathione S-transferase